MQNSSSNNKETSMPLGIARDLPNAPLHEPDQRTAHTEQTTSTTTTITTGSEGPPPHRQCQQRQRRFVCSPLRPHPIPL